MKIYPAKICMLLPLLILTALVLPPVKADAAGRKAQSPRCDYVEYQRLPLTREQHGIDGALVIMRDRSVQSADYHSSFDLETTCNASLYLLGRDNRRIATHKLDRLVAGIDTVKLIGGKPDSFSLKVDYYAGWGSYSGPITRFFDVVAGKIRWIHARNEKTGKIEDISLMNSLKTEWQLFPFGQNQDILAFRCRPAFKDENDNTFEVTFDRYRFNGREWILYSRSEKGFWESEEGTFPREALFPPVNLSEEMYRAIIKKSK